MGWYYSIITKPQDQDTEVSASGFLCFQVDYLQLLSSLRIKDAALSSELVLEVQSNTIMRSIFSTKFFLHVVSELRPSFCAGLIRTQGISFGSFQQWNNSGN